MLIFEGLKKFPKILLASQSPRRQFLFRETGLDFETVNINCDEDYDPELKGAAIAEYLALKKSRAYKDELNENLLVTADTIVCLSGTILNKPAGKAEAMAMLTLLSGHTHSVYTGVCMRGSNFEKVFHECSKVTFKELSDEEIEYYVDKYHPYDKAGSYGVQDWMGYVGVCRIEGCFYNVMGFPMSRFYSELENLMDN